MGAAKRSEVYAAIERYQASGTSFSDVKDSLRHENYEELGVNAFTEATRAYLKIQDGCDNFCSYCYIPTLRGNSRSRAPLEVIKEAESLVKVGHYPEIIIAGIHIGGYGKDLGDGSYRLADLLKDILTACPELMRLRISSIEESEIDSKFLALLKDYPQVVDHLHIPLQSGSSSVLKRMRRKYDTAAFLTKLQAIRAVRPDIAITTDVIAGFPLESDEEWAETMNDLYVGIGIVLLFALLSLEHLFLAGPLTAKKEALEALEQGFLGGAWKDGVPRPKGEMVVNATYRLTNFLSFRGFVLFVYELALALACTLLTGHVSLNYFILALMSFVFLGEEFVKLLSAIAARERVEREEAYFIGHFLPRP